MYSRMVPPLLWIAFSSAIWAQSTPRQYVSETQGASCEELGSLALARNKDLQAARESVHLAEARLIQAGLRPNPSVEASKTTDSIFANEGDNALSVMFSQPFELGGKRRKRVRVEEISIEVSKAEIRDSERQLLGRLQSLCVDAAGAASRLDLFDRRDRLNKQMVDVMEVRLAAGDASRLDSRLLAAQTNQVRAQRAVSENQLAAVALQIRALVGLAPHERLVLKSSQQPVQLHETEETLLSTAFESRPDLKAARLREELAGAAVTLAKSQAVPNATGFVRYGRESIPTLLVGEPKRSFERESVLELGISIPLPLFNREQGNIAEAEARRVQASVQREALEVAIRREVLLAFQRYETAQRTMEILKTGVLQPYQESFQIVQLAHNLGELRLLDVVNQQRIVVEAETGYLDAQKELNAAITDLELVASSHIH